MCADLWPQRLVVLLAFVTLCACEASVDDPGETESQNASTGAEASTEEEAAGDPCANPVALTQLDPLETPSGFFTCADGFIYRAQAVTCELGAWTEGSCGGDSSAAAACRQDSDCSEDANGFCLDGAEPWASCECNYACTSDADCADDSICYCNGANSVCIPATCRTDDDCPGDAQCALDEVRRACGDVRRSLHCTTPQDECRADGDCDSCLQCLVEFDQTYRSCSGSTGICGPCG